MHCVMHKTQDVLISKMSCEAGHMVRDIQSFNTTVDRFRFSPSLSGFIVVRLGQNEAEKGGEVGRGEGGRRTERQRQKEKDRDREKHRQRKRERELSYSNT